MPISNTTLPEKPSEATLKSDARENQKISIPNKIASKEENLQICLAIKKHDSSNLEILLAKFSTIDLSGMKIDDEDIEFLSQSLTENKNIDDISLNNNEITDQGAIKLA